jgi:hypothetical protein
MCGNFSVGKRYARRADSSCGNSESRRQNFTTSGQLTCSTGKSLVSRPSTSTRPPPVSLNQVGLEPMTACHCAWVTGTTPR